MLDPNERMSIADLMTISWFLGVPGGCTAANDDGCVVGNPTG